MATLTITSRGQVTFRKEVLRHLGVRPGEKIEVELIPGGRATLKLARKKGKIEDVFGLLKDRTNVELTIEEMDQAIGAAMVEELLSGVER
jgi:bifunctional DNA-binding transcriptional regulator/antitoxin component of YhaV-PrlF toxin-antitoxin module